MVRNQNFYFKYIQSKHHLQTKRKSLISHHHLKDVFESKKGSRSFTIERINKSLQIFYYKKRHETSNTCPQIHEEILNLGLSKPNALN